MKKNVLLLLCTLLCVGLVACGSEEKITEDSNVTENVTDEVTDEVLDAENSAEEEKEEADVETSEEVVEEVEEVKDPLFVAETTLEEKLGDSLESVIKSALLKVNNPYRLNRALDRAAKGENITVAYIGGSVTEGAEATQRTPEGYKKGYAYLSYEYIQEHFGTEGNVTYVNAGISGTPSELGVLRADIDVLEYYPDIVFIEFAVNNGSSEVDMATYESLIRKCLNYESEPAVVLLMSAATYAGYTQNYMIRMGDFYKLPVLSMHNGLQKVQKDEVIKWSDYSVDTVHPNQMGHALYAKCIAYLLEQCYAEKSYDSYEVPEMATVDRYTRFVDSTLIDNANLEGYVTSTGSFVTGKTAFSATGQSHNHALQNGFTRNAGAGNEPLVVQLECKNFTIVTKMLRMAETSLDVYVDGVFVKKIQTSSNDSWTNPVPYLVLDETEPKMHEIKIMASEGSENVTQVILGMAYN